MKHQYSWPFVGPVDTIKFALHDYFKIIKRPMDLGSVKKRLESNFYWCAQEAMDDIKLVFDNCYTYNKPNEDVCVMADSLQKFFNSKVRSMPPVECVVGNSSSSLSANSKTPKGKKVVPPGGAAVAMVTPKVEEKGKSDFYGFSLTLRTSKLS